MKTKFYPRIFEGEWLDKIYREKFGVEGHGDSDETLSGYEIVAKVGKHKTPIVKNPYTLRGIEADVRAIGDKEGNLYVSMHDEMFNHGEMANVLMDAGIIQTARYNSKATKVGEVHGIYDDQKNFVLLNRFEDEDIFIPSDCAEWEGEATEAIYRNLKKKHPYLQFETDDKYFDYIDDEDDEFDVRTLSKVSEALNESPDSIKYDGKDYNTKEGPGDTFAFECILNLENMTIADVLISNIPNKYHGDDKITDGPMYGEDGSKVSYENTGKAYMFSWKKVYPGRIFMKPRVITFWAYPDEKEMKRIIEIMEHRLKTNMIDNDWKVEVYKGGFLYKGEKEYGNNYDRDSTNIEMVAVEKFTGSKKPPESEYIQHLDTKKKHEVPHGYGTKNPSYMDKRKWQMASLTDEGKKEAFYPRLD